MSSRLLEVVDALPLRKGMRVLEIGCGPGAAAREVAARVADARGRGHVVGIDRSAKAIDQAERACAAEIAAGSLSFRRVAVEHFALEAGEVPFDLAFAVRVGALDGRHPALEKQALQCIARALKRGGRLFVDGGDPLRPMTLPR